MSEASFLNRELQWLEFNARVLAQAEDPRLALLERVRFLGIFTSNLDEFFMKRVGGLRRRLVAGLESPPLRDAIRARVLELLSRQASCWSEELRPALARAGLRLLPWKQLGRRRQAVAGDYFRSNVFPVLTPLAVDPGHPFPLVSNLSTSLGVHLRTPGEGHSLFARVKLPPSLPQWVRVDEGPEGAVFASLLEIVAHHLDRLFPGLEILGQMAFRVTRSAGLEPDTEDAEDLLEAVAEELRERRFAPIVRLEYGPRAEPWVLDFLVRELELGPEDVYALDSELDYGTLSGIVDSGRAELREPLWGAVPARAFSEPDTSVFDVIRERDVLVHHPYESFASSVLRFVSEAADDPRVLALKMIVYRTGEASPFVPLLVRAAEAGKQVVCLVELKARFDEARNIEVARALERAGVHVVYGLLGLKTHCKLVLAVRQEGAGVRAYAHIGTGNYNVKTAGLYTDLGLFTAREELLDDVMLLFNSLTGRSVPPHYERLLVAPRNMKEAIIGRIEDEARHAREGRPARIVAKMNQLEDRDVCLALYAASDAGVQIDLIVRGFCVLRPGVRGLSERIRVVSILGRFLEHARVFHFGLGEQSPLDGEFFLGSADWMRRNLEGRVEVLTPVDDRGIKERLWRLLSIQLSDRRLGWEMQPDGSYKRREPLSPDEPGSQESFMRLVREP